MTFTKKYIYILVCFFSFQCLLASDDIYDKYSIGICVIPEMEYIPEVDDWSIKERKIDPSDSLKAIALFKKHIPWVQGFITPKLVKSISRYANKEMVSYSKKPSLDSTCFSPRQTNGDDKKVLFEGTVDTLPTHSKIVNRWLKVYFIYNKATKSVLRVIITIRGQLLE